MSASDPPSPGNFLIFSELDTRRFGFRVYRGTATTLGAHDLIRQIADQRVDIAIIRVPAGTSLFNDSLASVGLVPIHADTLVYYRIDLEEHEPCSIRNLDLDIGEALVSDLPGIQDVAAHAFNGYISHYNANPFLDIAKANVGYIEWASTRLESRTPSNVTWVARRDGLIVGFLCCDIDQQARCCEIVLNAVHPSHAGGGIYSDLIRYAKMQCKQRGLLAIRVSTQIWNYAVQKVWARECFMLESAQDTYHFNAMLDAGETLFEQEIDFPSSSGIACATGIGSIFGEHLNESTTISIGTLSRIEQNTRYLARLKRVVDNSGRSTSVASLWTAGMELKMLCHATTRAQELG